MKPIYRDKSFEKHFTARVTPNKSLVERFELRLAMFRDGVRGKPINDHGLKVSELHLLNRTRKAAVRKLIAIVAARDRPGQGRGPARSLRQQPATTWRCNAPVLG